MHAKILQNYSKEFIYLIIYINNKYRQHLTLFFLLLPVTRYSYPNANMSFPDFGLQFLVVIILHSLTSYLKGCRFPGKVYTILISLTSY